MAEPTVVGVRRSERELDRRAAARDLWPGGTLDVWQGRGAPMPDVVWWPESAEEVAAVLGEATRLGVDIIPYGAGSGVCGGARGRVGAWSLDTKRLRRIGPLDADRWQVEVDAGVNGQHLEDWLQARGFTLGHSPSSIWCSTVGGWGAARSAGQFSSRYGVFEDMVLSVEAVAPGRGRFRVGEGGDAPAAWLPLLLGSEGTLAVLTRFTLRVWPLPETRWLRGYRFQSVGDAIGAMRSLMQAELWPSVVRLYDPVDTRVGGRTRPERQAAPDAGWWRRWLARVDALPAVRRRTLALPLALPGLLNDLADRLSTGCLLVVGWEGRPEVVTAASEAGMQLLAAAGGDDLGAGPGERWFHARHHVSYKLMPIFERGGFADTMEVATTWSSLEALYRAVREAVAPTALVMAHMSHVYPEGGSIYFSFAGRGDREVYDRTWERALEAVVRSGGTVTHHHGVGTLKAEAVSREVGPAVAGWTALKQVLDPGGRMNPGRLYVPGGPPPGPEALPSPLALEDGLLRVDGVADLAARQAAATAAGAELMWPWTVLDGEPTARSPWQTTAVEVAAQVDGVDARVGRGPRSASGPDLRRWLLAQPGARVTVAVTRVAGRWMGRGRPDRPWATAQALLRRDLRPAVLFVEDGWLYVGFRGPAAEAMGALAARWVGGGLEAVPYAPRSMPAGDLVEVPIDHPAVVAVTPHQALARRSEA